MKKLEFEGLGEEQLRKKAADMWDQIVVLESEKYDLEERRKRQDYDVSSLKMEFGFPSVLQVNYDMQLTIASLLGTVERAGRETEDDQP